MIATEPDSDKQELDLVRLRDLVRSNMNGFQKIMVGVLPARLVGIISLLHCCPA